MYVIEAKLYGRGEQFRVIDEMIRTAQFVRNKMLRYWMDNRGVGKKELMRYNTQYTSQECSHCGRMAKKSLSQRTHVCECGCILDRDENAAINILRKGLSTPGHGGIHAWGHDNRCQAGESLPDKLCG